MEFISVEEFLKQPVEIQNVLLKWWKPSVGDLYVDTSYNGIDDTEGILVFEEFQEDDLCAYGRSTFSFKNDCILLLSEGQIRKFIEDRTDFSIEQIERDSKGEYEIITAYHAIDSDKDLWWHDTKESNLLQAYWKVALEIAKEETKND